MTFAIILPLKRADLALATAGQEQQANHCRRQWGDQLLRGQRRAQATDLARGQEPLPPAPPVAAQARARIAVLRPVAMDLGLAQDQGQDRKRAVRRGRRRMQGGKPELYVLARNVSNGTPSEPGHDLVAQVRPIDRDGPRFPVTPVAAEDFFGDHLEQGLLIADRRSFGSGAHHGRPHNRNPAGICPSERVRQTEEPTDGPAC